MTKYDIQENDILEFANGTKIQVGINKGWIIREYYGEDLKCLKNDEYDIVAIYRPKYEKVFERVEERSNNR